jgi:ATP-dependent Clp protease adapter protein ClpS
VLEKNSRDLLNSVRKMAIFSLCLIVGLLLIQCLHTVSFTNVRIAPSKVVDKACFTSLDAISSLLPSSAADHHSIDMSTVVKPKRKTDTKKDTAPPKTDKKDGFVVKESRSIADEIEAYFNEDNYLVLLFNDPFNKRAYVSAVLQEVFKWDDMQADAIMMQAHMNGFAVVIETSKERAEDYVQRLTDKGLYAEAKKADGTDPEGQQE